MTGASIQRVISVWRRLTRLDQVALGIVLLEGAIWLGSRSGLRITTPGFLTFLFFLAASYLLVRFLGWWRSRLLWSLRNRLIVAYVFIAVVPVLLLLTMAVLSAKLLYAQLGCYLLAEDLRVQNEKLLQGAERVPIATPPSPPVSPAGETSGDVARELGLELPGLRVDLNASPQLFREIAPAGKSRFVGMVQSGETVSLLAMAERPTPRGARFVSLTLPVTSELLDQIAPYLGPIHLTVTQPTVPGDPQGVRDPIGSTVYKIINRISTRNRALHKPANWFDSETAGFLRMEAISLGPDAAKESLRPVFVGFSFRPSQLNRHLFASTGEVGGVLFNLLLVVGAIFLLLEIGALITGIILTRTITKTVAELYRATQYVQAGDLSHRVRIERKDQLGVLGESFNLMTSSVSNLIEEQRHRQKLENELSIAREVQAQLFPQRLPVLPGVRLQAVCRAARVVSGDYYDFIPLGPTRLGMAIADISGKGISAALLMASLQAALRSQAMTSDRGDGGTAELVARLNRHLFLNTSDDRFATFFYAEYDCASRVLTYTNAGHLPPLYISDGKVQKLEKGGMVVGVLEDCPYEQGRIHIGPGSLLVGYSDGLVEPENVYGEEFGMERLAEVALRLRDASPQNVAESLMLAAEEWAGTPEQADDMTVIVARME